MAPVVSPSHRLPPWAWHCAWQLGWSTSLWKRWHSLSCGENISFKFSMPAPPNKQYTILIKINWCTENSWIYNCVNFWVDANCKRCADSRRFYAKGSPVKKDIAQTAFDPLVERVLWDTRMENIRSVFFLQWVYASIACLLMFPHTLLNWAKNEIHCRNELKKLDKPSWQAIWTPS